MLYSAFWKSYQKVLPESLHQAVGKSEEQTNHWSAGTASCASVWEVLRNKLSFSKSEARHKICLVLFLHDYNRICLNNISRATTLD